MTYLVLNLVFLAVVCGTIQATRSWPEHRRPIVITLIILIVLTAIFDSILINLGFFYYEPTKLLGINIWSAPLEDFFYPAASVIIVPALWKYTDKEKDETKD